MSPAQTAEEAARRMLDSKKLSNKINYDVLANLFNTDAVQQGCGSTVMPMFMLTRTVLLYAQGSTCGRLHCLCLI